MSPWNKDSSYSVFGSVLLLFSLCSLCGKADSGSSGCQKKISFLLKLPTNSLWEWDLNLSFPCASKPPLMVVPNQAQHFVPLEQQVFSEVSDVMKIKSGCMSRVFSPNEAFQWFLQFSVPPQGPADLPGWFSLLTCPYIFPFTVVLSGAGHLRSH